MTVAVSWVGNGRQFTGDSATETTVVVKHNGAGGTPAIDVAVGPEGTDATTVPVNKQGVCLFIALPAALDFTTTESGELIYLWGKFLDESILATQALSGMGICLSSGLPTTSNYSLFSFFGSDKQPSGWERMILDPTKTRTAGAGTLTTSNITHIGVFADVGGTTARFDNLLLSACDVGTGLKITGTSTLGLFEELRANEAANIYGVVRALNKSKTASSLAGKLTAGDSAGVLASAITDENSAVYVEEPIYYNAGLVAAVPLTYCGLEIVGNATGDTSVIFGQAVGADNGRNGISLVGNDTYNVTLDRDDGAVETADFYGTTLQNLTGTLALDGTHDFNGNVMVDCGAASVDSDTKNLTSVGSGQITLAAGVKLIDSLVINNAAASSVSAALASQVDATSFTSDGSNNAVDLGTIAATATHTWNSILSGYVTGTSGTDVGVAATGNEAILVSVASGQVLTISVADGATIPSVANTGLGTVDVVAGLVTLSVATQTGNEVRIRQGSYTLQHNQSIAGGIETYSYTYAAGTKVTITVGAAGYVRKSELYTLTDSDATLLLALEPSPSYIV